MSCVLCHDTVQVSQGQHQCNVIAPKSSLEALAIWLQVPHKQEVPSVEWEYVQMRRVLEQYVELQVLAGCLEE